MSLYVEINGVQQRGLAGVGITSVRVQQSLQNRNTAEVGLIVTNNATTYSEGQQIDIGNGSTRYFVGTIANLRKTWVNPWMVQQHSAQPEVVYALQCVSFDQIASRRFVVQTSGPVLPLVYTDTSAGAIMRDVATQFLGGENIGLTGVLDGPTFTSFSVEPGAKVYDVFDAIADNAGMYWDILGALNAPELRLYARGSLPSAWSIGVTSPIVSDGGGETGFTVEVDRADLANEVYTAISEGPGNPTTQDFLGDGSSRDFSVDKPIDSQPTIKVDGVSKAVSIKNYITADWYWTPGSPTVEQDVSQPILTAANTLSVEYTPRENIVVLGAKDDANIAARALLESTSGRYQAVISAADGATIATAATAAAAYLAAHKIPALQLAMRSFASQAEAVGIGQTIAVSLPPLGVNATFLVESVQRSYEGKIAATGEDAILHRFTLSTGNVIGDWVTKFASAWSVGGSGGASAAGAVVQSGGGRATVQDLGTLTADTTANPSPSSPVAGDLLLVTWSLGTTIYTLTWGTGFAGTARADYRPRTPSTHAYFFIYALDQWNLISWRTDI